MIALLILAAALIGLWQNRNNRAARWAAGLSAAYLLLSGLVGAF